MNNITVGWLKRAATLLLFFLFTIMVGCVRVKDVHPPSATQALPEASEESPRNVDEALEVSGGKLFQQLRCSTCHLAGPGPGPSLVGLFGKTVQLQDGKTVLADEEYIRESMLNPAAKIVAGYSPVMPSFQGQIDEQEMSQIIAYIKSLK